MKVWVITSVGIGGSQIVGVMPDAASAKKLLTTSSHVAVEMDLGKDYTHIHKFVVMTRDNLKPRMIDFGQVIENLPRI